MKKHILISLLISLSTTVAFAGSNSQDRPQRQNANASSKSLSEASNAGNTQSIIFTSPGESATELKYSGTQTVKNVPSVNAPHLSSSNDTCMGSVSGAVNVAGFGGAFGKTYKDANCVMLKNSRELWNMGMRAAALARMCMDGDNREALEITGFKCPQTDRVTRSTDADAPPK
jgi:hypothetical protein